MSVGARIQEDTKTAMKQRDRSRVGALRMLGAALKNAEIEAGRALTEQEEQTILRRQLKQRDESAEAPAKQDARNVRHPNQPKPRSSAPICPNPSRQRSSRR